MAQSKNTPKVAEKSPLLNEGVELKLEQLSPQADGKQRGHLNLLAAAAPLRKFVADGFALIETESLVRIVFVQTKVDGVNPRALLDIHVSPLSMKQFIVQVLNKPSSDGQNACKPMELTEEPEQTVAVTANFFRAVTSVQGSLLDCFYSSPLAMSRVAVSKSIFIEGVVRVQLQEFVYRGLINSFAQLKIMAEGNQT